MALMMLSKSASPFWGWSEGVKLTTVNWLLKWSNTMTTLYNIYSMSGASFFACVSSFTAMSSK